MTETRRLPVATRDIEVEIYPPDETPAPGILLLHELFGLRDYIREDASDLASRGYLVFVPDLFTGGAVRYCVRAMVMQAGRDNRETSDPNREVHQLLDALKADPRCNGRLGMLGACLSGGFVIQMAKRPDMAAPVLYHHSLGMKNGGVPDDESLDTVTRLQGHWSRRDVFCPAARRQRLAERLGDRLEAHVYDMPHGFRSVSRGRPEAPLVWQRTLRFFAEHLKVQRT